MTKEGRVDETKNIFGVSEGDCRASSERGMTTMCSGTLTGRPALVLLGLGRTVGPAESPSLKHNTTL